MKTKDFWLHMLGFFAAFFLTDLYVKLEKYRDEYHRMKLELEVKKRKEELLKWDSEYKTETIQALKKKLEDLEEDLEQDVYQGKDAAFEKEVIQQLLDEWEHQVDLRTERERSSF